MVLYPFSNGFLALENNHSIYKTINFYDICLQQCSVSKHVYFFLLTGQQTISSLRISIVLYPIKNGF